MDTICAQGSLGMVLGKQMKSWDSNPGGPGAGKHPSRSGPACGAIYCIYFYLFITIFIIIYFYLFLPFKIISLFQHHDDKECYFKEAK